MFENIGEQAVIEGQLLEQVFASFLGGSVVLEFKFYY